MLLRQEVREPALYNSALDAIGAGNTTPQRIASIRGSTQIPSQNI